MVIRTCRTLGEEDQVTVGDARSCTPKSFSDCQDLNCVRNAAPNLIGYGNVLRWIKEGYGGILQPVAQPFTVLFSLVLY